MEPPAFVKFDAVPYCGIAPLPADLWSRWNLDPWTIAALLAIAFLGLAYGRHDSRGRLALSTALALMGVVFVSPLCALASALFSARVAHHLLLIAAVAPLLALVFPLHRTDAPRGAAPIVPLAALTLAHAVIVWIWHIPAPYRFALSSDSAYWLMQSSLLLGAFFLWRRILSTQTSPGAALLALLGTMMQMGLLGALLAFAPRAVFTPHFGRTLPYGMTELQDQQLAGLLMWAPAMLPYVAVALIMSIGLLRASGEVAAR